MHRARRHLLSGVGAAFATSSYAAWLAWGVGGETSVLYVADLGTVLAALVATVLCLRAGNRQAGRLRLFWRLLAAACGAWTLGEAIWAVYDLVLHRDVPVPSFADVGYLAGVPLAVAALLSHPAMRGSGARRSRGLIDGLAVATALLFLSWTFVLGPLWESTDLTTAGGVVALAYPFGDVVLVFFVLLVVRGMTRDGRLALWWLLAGLLAMALADSTYAYLVEVNAYETGTLLDSGWVAGYLAIAVGALCSDSRGGVAPRAEPSAGLAPILAAFLPLLAALTVVGIQIELGQRPDRVGLIMAFVLVVISLLRQGLLVLELIAPHGEREGGVVMRVYASLLGGTLEDRAEPAAPLAPDGSPP